MYEPTALAIRIWENRIVHGLFQTEAYARALLRDGTTVKERMNRRNKVFDEGEPASVKAVMGESALRTVVGSRGAAGVPDQR